MSGWRYIEGAGFVSVAALLHMGFWWSSPAGVLDAAGSGGAEVISVAGISSEIANVVAAVDQPIDVVQSVEVAMVQPAPVTAPLVPQPPQISAPPQPTPAPAPAPLDAALPSLPSLPSLPPRAPTPVPEIAETPPETSDLALQSSPVPARKPAPPTPKHTTAGQGKRTVQGQTQTVARGTGGGQAAGNSGTNDTPSMSDATRVNLMKTWGAKVGSHVQTYVGRVRSREMGRAVLQLTLHTDGRLIGVSLYQSSGQDGVDQAAMAAVQKVRKFPKAPAEVAPGTYPMILPVMISN